MTDEKKLPDDALDAVSGGVWSAPGYLDYGPQPKKDSTDQVNGQLAVDGNSKQQP